MRLYSYVLDHDVGFAPNPFHGWCTLATCKPVIRRRAQVGDYIVGTGCAKRKRSGFVVYFMRVEETLSFDDYWNDPRFAVKRPAFNASRQRAFGDNIYHRDGATLQWRQASSFHSEHDGSANPKNVATDTSTNRVLLSRDFAYWGGRGPAIPEALRAAAPGRWYMGRSHRVNFPDGFSDSLIAWLRSLGARGYVGRPTDWPSQ